MNQILDIQLRAAKAGLDINDVIRAAGINRATWWRWTSGKFSLRCIARPHQYRTRLRDPAEAMNQSDNLPPATATEAKGCGGWQPIETAPKGGGAERADDPAWVEPPKILMAFENGELAICYFDHYYAPNGHGFTGLLGWVETGSGEEAQRIHGTPTHWMPLPQPPERTKP